LLVVSPGRGAGTETVGTLGSAEIDQRAEVVAVRMMGRTDTSRGPLDAEDGDSDVFAEAFSPPPRLVIVGATPIGEALCAFASAVGFDVIVVDPREAFARPERFPGAADVIVEWPDSAFEQIGVDPFSSVVLLTHDGKLDHPALAAALDAGCRYIGLLGGRRTQRQRREALAAAGYGDPAIAEIRGPVGLDIGAKSPSQIAVSILAELIAEGRAP
jgi:xanthine dehydrogenase accessory factor